MTDRDNDYESELHRRISELDTTSPLEGCSLDIVVRDLREIKRILKILGESVLDDGR